MTVNAVSGDVITEKVHICEYRECEMLIPKDRQGNSNPAKYHCRACGLKEAALLRIERRQQKERADKDEVWRIRKIERDIKAKRFHEKLPHFYDVLLQNAKHFFDKHGCVPFRLIWERSKFDSQVTANDHLMVWYKKKLEKDLIKSSPDFKFNYKKRG